MSRRKHPLRRALRSFSVSSYGRVDRGIYAEDNPMWGVDRAVGRRVISTTALLLLALGAVACADGSDSSPSTPSVRRSDHRHDDGRILDVDLDHHLDDEYVDVHDVLDVHDDERAASVS